MFLHIGSENLVFLKDIICIIDLKKNNSKINNDLIEDYKEKDRLVLISDDCKSIVLTKDNLYLTSISSDTLKKRIYRY